MCVCECIYIHAYIHIHTCIHTYVHMYMCTCMCACMCVFVFYVSGRLSVYHEHVSASEPEEGVRSPPLSLLELVSCCVGAKDS